MPNSRRAWLTLLVSAAGAVIVLGCDRTADAPRTDSVTVTPVPPPPVDSQRRPVPSGWESTAGPVLLVTAERPEAAIVVYPEIQGEHAAAELTFDTTALQGSPVTLITRSGRASTATLGSPTRPTEEEDCVGWPMLSVVAPSESPPAWSIGLIGTRLTPVALDSVGSLSPADSSTLVVEVARLASAVPLHEQAALFRGLPFSVQDVRRFRMASGTDVLIAHVVRRVHEEANPLEERTLLIAERDTAQRREARGRYALAFYRRAVGREETLEGSEVLAALAQRQPSRPILVLAHESEGGVRYVLVERSGLRSWRVRWTSALVRC